MTDPKYCYHEITQKAEFLPQYFKDNFDSFTWNKYFQFDAVELPIQLVLDNEPILKKLHKTFEIEGVGFLRVTKHSTYNWHKDKNRGVTINLLVSTPETSHCIFARDSDSIVSNITELKYEPNTFYIFNTQVSHMVINTGEDRYMFSVRFKLNREKLSYFHIKNWAISNAL